MKARLKRIASCYLDSWWLPAVLCGVLVFLATFIFFEKKFAPIYAELLNPPRFSPAPWLPNPFFMIGLAILSCVGLLESFFKSLVKRRWIKSLKIIAVSFGVYILLSITIFFTVNVRQVNPLIFTTNEFDPPPVEEIQTTGDAP